MVFYILGGNSNFHIGSVVVFRGAERLRPSCQLLINRQVECEMTELIFVAYLVSWHFTFLSRWGSILASVKSLSSL